MRTQKQENDGAKMLDHRSQLLLRHRLIILFIGLAIIITAIVLWILYSGPPWYTVLPAIIVSGLGLIIALFQWIFPLTPHEPVRRLNELVEKKRTDNLEPQQVGSNNTFNLNNEQMKANTKGTYPDPDTIFQFNVPLAHPGEFYGRKNTRATLIGRTRKRGSTSIVGERRAGKTWLISYLRLIASSELGSGFRVAYVNAASPNCATETGFISRVLEELLGYAFVGTTAAGLNTLEQVVKDMRLRNQLPVLCIDEFERLVNQREFDVNFFTALRAIEQIGLVLVIASKQPLINLVSEHVQTSPFFNVFEQLTLQPFRPEEAKRFVLEKGNQAEFTQQECDYHLRYSKEEQGWPPLRLQLVGKMLLEDKNRSLDEDTSYYRPDDQSYWLDFETRMEEKYRGVIGK